MSAAQLRLVQWVHEPDTRRSLEPALRVDALGQPAPARTSRGDRHARGGDAPGDEAGIFQRGDADGDVEALGHRIDEPVVEDHLDLEAGVGGHEIGDRRAQMQQAEGERRGQPQRPLKRGI